MAKRYKMVRMPIDVWETWFKKKNLIQENTNKKISLTNVLRYYGRGKQWVDFETLLRDEKKTKKNNKFKGQII